MLNELHHSKTYLLPNIIAITSSYIEVQIKLITLVALLIGNCNLKSTNRNFNQSHY